MFIVGIAIVFLLFSVLGWWAWQAQREFLGLYRERREPGVRWPHEALGDLARGRGRLSDEPMENSWGKVRILFEPLDDPRLELSRIEARRRLLLFVGVIVVAFPLPLVLAQVFA